MASIQMRELINNILQDTTKDMREQADRVENAFAKRIEEMAGAKAKMENQLENVKNKTINFKPYYNQEMILFKLNRLWTRSPVKKIISMN